MRFAFGRNWQRFVARNFSEKRLAAAQRRLLGFLERSALDGLDMLDIGCGSGIHSYAALKSGARRIHSFDYDPNSVSATCFLRDRAGRPQNWTVDRGDVLDENYLKSLGKWSFVYSWGVLHHTGDVWQAIRTAQSAVADGGLFFIALYSADVQPLKEYWLEVKQRYNKSNDLEKQRMVWWYIWRHGMQGSIYRAPQVIRQIVSYRYQRGMNYFTDVRDWLGGWPMEYTADQDVVDLLEGTYGFRLINVTTGQACSEFLFERSGPRAHRTNVKDMVARKVADSISV